MSKKFFLGTIFGAAIGATVALLYAPKEGKELREDLADKAYDLKDIALDYVELATVKSAELKDAAIKKTSSIADNIKTSAQDMKTHFAEKTKNFSNDVEAVKESVKAATEETIAEAEETVEDVKDAVTEG